MKFFWAAVIFSLAFSAALMMGGERLAMPGAKEAAILMIFLASLLGLVAAKK